MGPEVMEFDEHNKNLCKLSVQIKEHNSAFSGGVDNEQHLTSIQQIQQIFSFLFCT